MFLNTARDIQYLIYLQIFFCIGSAFSFLGAFRDYSEEDVGERVEPEVLRDLWNTVLYVYSMLLGNVELELLANRQYAFFYQVMFLVFVYIQAILLMNLVIAMMGESFERVLQTAQRELTMDRAELLVRVEMTMGVAKMRHMGYLPRYLQVLLAPSDMKGSHSESPGSDATEGSKLGRSATELLEQLHKNLRMDHERKAEHLTDQIMSSKRDMKDHLNSLEQRLGAAIGAIAATESANGSGVAALTFAPGTPEEQALRRIIHEELLSKGTS